MSYVNGDSLNTQNDERYIYADNAATTPLSPRALEAMTPHLEGSFGNPSGIHRIAREAAKALSDARSTMARFLGAASPDEVYFTSGGSEADNWILRGAVGRHRDLYGQQAPARIITSSIEHHAVLHCCEALEREGVLVTYLPVDQHGLISPADLEAALTANEAAEREADAHIDRQGALGVNAPSSRTAPPATALVSIMMANNEVGTIEPIRELAAIAHAHGVPFHTDAVQAMGHIPVNVCDLGVDALSLSAHKFHGPQGTGALYLRDGLSIPPLIAGGGQERGVRAGTENLAGIVGMAAALEEACEHLASTMGHIESLRNNLAHHILDAVDAVELTGAPIDGPGRNGASPACGTTRLPSIASFICHNVDGELLVVLLDRAGVAAATGSACSTGSTEPSHVLTAMGVPASTARGALRLSLASDATAADIELLCQRVPACIKRARLISGMR